MALEKRCARELDSRFDESHQFRRERVAYLVPNLLDYQIARLNATNRVLKATDRSLHVVTFSPLESDYAWTGSLQSVEFDHIMIYDTGKHEDRPVRQTCRRLLNLLNRLSPDIVFICGYRLAAMRAALRWCRGRKVPTVLFSDTTRQDAPRVFWKEWIKRRIVRQFDAALVAGTRASAYVQSLGMRPASIVTGYDVVDNAHFATGSDLALSQANETRAELGLRHQGEYFLAVSRLVPRKNLAILLKAMSMMPADAVRQIPNLVVCGDGYLQAELQKMADALDLSERVMFAGHVDYETIPSYYGLASGLLLPSFSEPWGLVVNEAMAAGLPVITSERAGCSEDLVVSNLNGWTCDPNDAGNWVECMTRLARMGVEARRSMGLASQRIIEEWDLNRFANGFLQAISLALVKAGRGQ